MSTARKSLNLKNQRVLVPHNFVTIMPRELLTIQVGQCGNQVGTKFWELALNEHAKHAKNDVYDDSLSSFFRNVDIRYSHPP